MASPPVSPNVQNFGHYTDVGKRSKHLKEEYTRKYNIEGTYGGTVEGMYQVCISYILRTVLYNAFCKKCILYCIVVRKQLKLLHSTIFIAYPTHVAPPSYL